MKMQSTNKAWWSTLGNLLLPILIALIFFAFTFAYYPFREKLQFDTDEGLNLMRSMLMELGHPLYSEVSSDQAPLFNQILALMFHFTGFEVNASRILVLLFSSLMVWACAQFLQLTWGKLSAILFLPLAIMVPRYMELSVSVMIGVPSIAFAIVAMLFVTLWHQQRKIFWLILSGCAMALSVLIKLFTGFIVPIFLIGLTVQTYLDNKPSRFSWKLLQPAIIWSLCFGGLTVLLGILMIGPQNLPAIIYPHLMAGGEDVFQNDNFTINMHLAAAVPLMVLGIYGGLISIYRKNWLTLYPLAWAALAYPILNFYSPVFYHHQLLITIPMAMLAAAGVGDGITSLIHVIRTGNFISQQTALGALTLIGFLLVSLHYIPLLDKELYNKPRLSGITLKATAGKLKILDAMDKYASQTNWILTDMPMYAFRVRRPVPPNLATFSQKRLSTGSLTEADIMNAMQEYNPEQVLMARFEIPPLEAYLKEHYTLVLSAEFFRLFIRNDIKPISQ
jgi:4-amino-4-deoxy-L-arabinose transferase-like glycosyltransferase